MGERTGHSTDDQALKQRALEVHARLIKHYGEPTWHAPLPAIDELVSTILSQNTNDVNRDRAFNTLRKRLPTWEAVRDAEPSKVIDAIRQAGLANQKGPRIQAALREITAQRGSLDLEFLKALQPDEARAWLRRFKGVGLKTSAIVLLFALSMPAFPVDTHIYRVTGRIGLRPAKMTLEQAHIHLEALFPPDTYYSVHLNLIHLGREICQSRRPLCSTCPLQDICDYYAALPPGVTQ